MTIIVKKPFEPFEDKSKVNSINAEQIHPEFEEKPVMSTTQISEETHGGSEVTFSLPDSPGNSPANSSEQEKQGNQSTINEQANQVNAPTSNADTNSSLEPTQEPQDATDDTNTQNVNNGDSKNNGTNANAVNNNQGQENGEENSDNSNESENANDEQSQSGVYNTQQVVDVTNGNIINAKYYQTEFYRFIELISEEKTRTFDPMGSDEYNVKKLLFRRFERKPLSSYKMSRVRESVVIILDNSGSMQWWADNLQILADLAMKRNDVELYLAPNGYVEEMLYPRHQLVNHNEIMKRLRNRKIIYVGDFDGADTPIELSWYNDVIWICPEERYIHFLDHDWVHYDESQFKGAFLRVFTLGEMFNAFRRLLSNPSLKIWYDLCNETRCGGGEGA